MALAAAAALAVATAWASPLCAQGARTLGAAEPLDERGRVVAVGETRVTVLMAGERSVVRVATPVGVFRVRADSATLAGWADAAAALAPPRATADGTAAYDGIVLRSGDRPDVLRLVRATADSLPEYLLDVSNGGWDHRERVAAAAVPALLAALRGVPDPAAPVPRRRPLDAPLERGDGPRYEFEVEAPVVPLSSSPPAYPRELWTAGVEGIVVLQWVVTPAGATDPASLHVVSSSAPEFTRAVREAVLAMRFQPARIGGRAVAQLVQQPFHFTLR